ncbi:MAG: tubulin--tyrosine ligase family protein [Lachnospiraceae bacterium]|nr:tubulin--tyrosine ligase family protein [Lachnospiraceae bacterium]
MQHRRQRDRRAVGCKKPAGEAKKPGIFCDKYRLSLMIKISEFTDRPLLIIMNTEIQRGCG